MRATRSPSADRSNAAHLVTEAVLTPTILGLIIFCTIELQNGLVHSVFKLATIVQLLLAIGQLTLEFYEVYVKGN
ncbi:unnamed protein product [Strongylus vulgaris]|uniref:DUF7087 domain-containing protein n=1 Tax=Strongylus vulgaris TaxID=40348 RepID=A0A3P7L1A0_STRVU|nr:unnamed protein product [Strongylus vulgaris]